MMLFTIDLEDQVKGTIDYLCELLVGSDYKSGDDLLSEEIVAYVNWALESHGYSPKQVKYTEVLPKTEVEHDSVNHPNHYISDSGLEVIDVIDAFTGDMKGTDAFYTAQVLKYILRWNHKNGVEDLKKAQWYLNRFIDKKEGK